MYAAYIGYQLINGSSEQRQVSQYYVWSWPLIIIEHLQWPGNTEYFLETNSQSSKNFMSVLSPLVDKETETQRGKIIRPKPHGGKAVNVLNAT